MGTRRPYGFIARNRTPFLLALASTLQVLDWHSSVTASRVHLELNPMVIWAMRWLPFSAALGAVKAIDICILATGYLFWRRNRWQYELEFGVCLIALIIVYTLIIAHNYHV